MVALQQCSRRAQARPSRSPWASVSCAHPAQQSALLVHRRMRPGAHEQHSQPACLNTG